MSSARYVSSKTGSHHPGIETITGTLTNFRPPLDIDTIKVRMQLSRRARQPGAPKRGFLKTGAEIMKRETPLGLYKGLGATREGRSIRP